LYFRSRRHFVSSSRFVSAAPKLLNLIVACSENRVIGRAGRLPWRIPEDFRFFQAQTAGQVCVLGRICFETWPRAAEDGRRAVVVSRRATLAREQVVVVPSLNGALKIAEDLPGDIYICGGESIYAEILALAGQRPLRLYLTLVHANVAGDRFFPEWRHLPWQETERRESADAYWRYTFSTLDLPANFARPA
jgi:dihydrofolate reductase